LAALLRSEWEASCCPWLISNALRPEISKQYWNTNPRAARQGKNERRELRSRSGSFFAAVGVVIVAPKFRRRVLKFHAELVRARLGSAARPHDPRIGFRVGVPVRDVRRSG
jgi:hypothetical protein